MANREVNLTKQIQTTGGWRYCPVALPANGRVKPDEVLVNGKEERHTEGAYYLEWPEGTKRVRVSVGEDAQDAAAQRLRKESELNAKNHGVAVAPTPSNNGHRLLSVAITEWLAEIKLTKKPKTLAAYSNGLGYFAESYVQEVVRIRTSADEVLALKREDPNVWELAQERCRVPL